MQMTSNGVNGEAKRKRKKTHTHTLTHNRLDTTYQLDWIQFARRQPGITTNHRRHFSIQALDLAPVESLDCLLAGHIE